MGIVIHYLCRKKLLWYKNNYIPNFTVGFSFYLHGFQVQFCVKLIVTIIK